jgi:hypothetical protein
MSRDASNSKNAINSRKANNSRTASNSKFERNLRNGSKATPGMPTIPGRQATVTHQELKGRQLSKYRNSEFYWKCHCSLGDLQSSFHMTSSSQPLLEAMRAEFT